MLFSKGPLNSEHSLCRCSSFEILFPETVFLHFVKQASTVYAGNASGAVDAAIGFPENHVQIHGLDLMIKFLFDNRQGLSLPGQEEVRFILQ